MHTGVEVDEGITGTVQCDGVAINTTGKGRGDGEVQLGTPTGVEFGIAKRDNDRVWIPVRDHQPAHLEGQGVLLGGEGSSCTEDDE